MRSRLGRLFNVRHHRSDQTRAVEMWRATVAAAWGGERRLDTIDAVAPLVESASGRRHLPLGGPHRARSSGRVRRPSARRGRRLDRAAGPAGPPPGPGHAPSPSQRLPAGRGVGGRTAGPAPAVGRREHRPPRAAARGGLRALHRVGADRGPGGRPGRRRRRRAARLRRDPASGAAASGRPRPADLHRRRVGGRAPERPGPGAGRAQPRPAHPHPPAGQRHRVTGAGWRTSACGTGSSRSRPTGPTCPTTCACSSPDRGVTPSPPTAA